MKRIGTALAAAAVAMALFAPAAFAQDATADDTERVLQEARTRAGRQGAQEEAAPPAQDADEPRAPSAPAGEGPGAEEEDIYLPFAFSLLPGSPFPGKKVDATVGLGLVISELDDVYGLQASFVGSVAQGDVNGWQGAYVFNSTRGEVRGAQTSYVFNRAGGRLFGFQSAWVFNTAKGGGAAQAAGIFNVAEEDFTGAQAAGIFNTVGGPANGIQAAGLFNVAGGPLNGIQAAGLFNVAGGPLNGIQAAGLFNVAGGDVRGIQVGLVNVADSIVGLQLGLINVIRNGIHDSGVWFEDSGYAYGFLQKGTAHLYTLYYVGAPREDWFVTGKNLAAGAGMGFRLGGNQPWMSALDLDLSAKAHLDQGAIERAVEDGAEYHPRVFPSLRASLRLPLGRVMALHGGAVMDLEYEGGPSVDEPFRESDTWSRDIFGTTWTAHPKWFVGISF